MNTDPANEPRRSRPWPKWAHGLLFLLVGPLVAFAVSGVAYGLPELPATARAASLDFALWLGVTGIAIVVAWGVLVVSRVAGWTVLLALAAAMGYVGSPVGAGQQDSAVAQRSTGSERQEANQPRAQSVLVNEAVEEMTPGMSDTIDATAIQRFEEFMKDDVEKRLRQHFAGLGPTVPEFTTLVSTLHLVEEGHDIYVTEIEVSEPGTPKEEMPSFYVFWNFHDNKLKRVQCAYEGEAPPYRKGKCGAQIAKTFQWEGWYTP